MTAPVVVYESGKAFADRHTIAALTGRSVHTIRARCQVALHKAGRALYDIDHAETVLTATPTRRRRAVDQAA